MPRLRILTIVDYYLPGSKGGGPVHSVRDLAAHLGGRLQFDIVTSDRDLGDSRPYPGVESGAWLASEGARVLYLPVRQRTTAGWRSVLLSTPCDLVYLNSLFSRSTIRLLWLRRVRAIPRVPFLLAPRGELHEGALSIHRGRKRAWLRLSRLAGLYDHLRWHAATPEEARDIQRAIGPAAEGMVRVARHVPFARPEATCRSEAAEGRDKRPGRARIVFVSRISRKKNLDLALRLVSRLQGDVEFDIYGPVEDEAYWRECQALIDALASSSAVRYRGPLMPAEVAATFANYHVFLFPTRGESFGRIVVESLMAGCPVLVSDRTPWRGLPSSLAGWDVPLDDPGQFLARLEELVQMDGESFARWSAGARRLGAALASNEPAVAESARLFSEVADPDGSRRTRS